MNTTDTSRAIPRLRFPMFSDKWNLAEMKNLFSFKNGINANKEQYGRGYKFINVLDIINNRFITNSVIRGKVDIDEKMFQKNQVTYGDIVFQRSSETREEVGQANVYLDEKEAATFGGFVIHGKRIGEYEPQFMNLLLKTQRARKDITSRSGGSTRYNIGQESLSKVSLYLPSLKEQQKIASFFYSIDEWTEYLHKQLAGFKEYKKAIQIKLFSQKLRFKNPEGENYSDWESKLLGDLFNERNDRNGEKDYQLLSVKTHGGVVPQGDTNKTDSSNSDKSKYKVVKVGDIAYNTMRMWQGASGVSLYEGIVSPAYTVVYPKKGDANFYGYLFKHQRTIFNFYRYSQGLTSDTWNLKFQHFSEVEVTVPSDVEEQEKIATFLSSLDELIEHKEKQIALAEQWKKGLLQQMFV